MLLYNLYYPPITRVKLVSNPEQKHTPYGVSAVKLALDQHVNVLLLTFLGFC